VRRRSLSRRARSASPERVTRNIPGRGPLPWRSIAATIISIVGLGVAIYLTYEHFTGSKGLTCPLGGGAINCLAVTTSKESVVFGIPVALLGLFFFVPMIALSLPWAWRTSRRYVAQARLAMSVIGIGFVFYLVYAELFEIRSICIWCTSVHVLTLLLFIITVTGWEDATAAWYPADEDD
jgi:uncharacterized membrane protein